MCRVYFVSEMAQGMHLDVVYGVIGGNEGVFTVHFVSETAQVELKSGTV